MLWILGKKKITFFLFKNCYAVILVIEVLLVYLCFLIGMDYCNK